MGMPTAGVGIHHLLGGDDLDLHRVGVEPIVRGMRAISSS
jgi:hypothetical protein